MALITFGRVPSLPLVLSLWSARRIFFFAVRSAYLPTLDTCSALDWAVACATRCSAQEYVRGLQIELGCSCQCPFACFGYGLWRAPERRTRRTCFH